MTRQISSELIAKIEDLLAECLDDYDWQTRLAKYPVLREKASENYQAILAARSRGEDVTDMVLEGLLPHNNTSHNRKTGRWIHVAPSITRNIKVWYEASGWTEPEDWPVVAGLILEFVERCVDEPTALPRACNEFADHPLSTGFQAGTLSPILNALRPDDFRIINNKSRKLLNYFLDVNHGSNLRDYPAANSDLIDLVKAIRPSLSAGPTGAYRAGDVFDTLTHWLVSKKNYPPQPQKTKYWKISPGANARYWPQCRDGGYIAIGWNELGDISGMSLKEFEARRDELIATHDNFTKTALNQVWRFSRMSEGDVVVSNRGISEVVGIGEVTGEYYFDADATDLRHRMPVDWSDTMTRKVDQPGWRRTLVKLDAATVEEIENATIVEGDVALEPIDDIAPDEPGESAPTPLESAENIVLFGPPGTGKTWSTKRRAVELCLRPDERLDDDEIEDEYKRLRHEGRIEFLTFHQSFAYEEFVEGIRPVMNDDEEDKQVVYECEAGTFKTIALRAAAEGVAPSTSRRELTDGQRVARLKDFLRQSDRREITVNYEDAPDYVLVIDEINRGNISKILGELITLLEPSKRLTAKDELIVQLPYSKEHFAVPPNLHIIGTMNTADRSIALMDAALRRRFTYEEVLPDWRIIRDHLDSSVSTDIHGGKGDFINLVIAVFRNINARIEFLFDRDHMLGHSYLLDVTGYETLRAAFTDQVIPLLQEYFYGSWDRLCLALGCPYDEHGSPARDDGHALEGPHYRAPLINVTSLVKRDLLGLDHGEFRDQLRFQINPRLSTGGLATEELRQFFVGILSGDYLADFKEQAYYLEGQ